LLGRLVDRTIQVDEQQIADAIMLLLERTKLVVEGAGGGGPRGAPREDDRAHRRHHRDHPLGGQHRHRRAG
jgi:threonine dehydratase